MSAVFVAAFKLPALFGEFTMHGFLDEESSREHVALGVGDVVDGAPVLNRLHSERLIGDALFSLCCDCSFWLEDVLIAIAEEGRDVSLYLHQEGRDIGLLNEIRAYKLQDAGVDTVEVNLQLGFGVDQCDYAMCQPIPTHLGVSSPCLVANNPHKVKALESYTIVVAEHVPLQRGLNKHNRRYLTTRVGRLGHMLDSLHQGEAGTT